MHKLDRSDPAVIESLELCYHLLAKSYSEDISCARWYLLAKFPVIKEKLWESMRKIRINEDKLHFFYKNPFMQNKEMVDYMNTDFSFCEYMKILEHAFLFDILPEHISRCKYLIGDDEWFFEEYLTEYLTDAIEYHLTPRLISLKIL